MSESSPSAVHFGESCAFCWATARAVEIDGTTLTAVDHEETCPVIADPLPPRRAKGPR
jgi:hypothetical protein